MITTAQPSGEVPRDISPLELGLNKRGACTRLGRFFSDIIVDVHLFLREWIDAVDHDVDCADGEDELNDNEHVTPEPPRREFHVQAQHA